MPAVEYYVTADAAGGGDGLSTGSPWTFAEALAAGVSGAVINLKAGTYPLASEITLPVDNVWRGYHTTPGDLVDVGRTGPTGPLDVTNYPVGARAGGGGGGVQGFLFGVNR